MQRNNCCLFKIAVLWIVMSCGLAASLSAQSSLKWLDSLSIPKGLAPTGFLQSPDDTTFILAANGGLYTFNQGGKWLVLPDSGNYLLSFLMQPAKERSFFSIYEKKSNETSVFWRFRSDSSFQNQQFSTLANGAFRLLMEGDALFAYGFEADTFRVFAFSADTVMPVYSSHEYLPGDVRALSRNTLLMSFGKSLVSLDRSDGLKELARLPVPITSFSVHQPGNELWVTTPDGLGVFDGSELKILEPKAKGFLTLSDDRLIVMNGEAHRVDVFRIVGKK